VHDLRRAAGPHFCELDEAIDAAFVIAVVVERIGMIGGAQGLPVGRSTLRA
jgi:hypothetical protein